jgi:murein DD-endopeptidase MepM/ murein hydrolase activator NlpD
MGKCSSAWRAVGRAAISILLMGLAAACADMTATEPAPVYMKGAAEAGPVAPAPQRHEVRITVRPGQSVRGLAHAYHVPERAIIAANHLPPPYKVKIGQSLVIPGALEASPVRQAALPPKTVYEVPPAVRQAPLPVAAAPAPGPIAAAPAPPPVSASSGPTPIRDIISLDDPAPAPKAIAFPNPPPERPAAPAQSQPAITPPTFSSGQAQPARGPSAAEEARAEPAKPAAMHGGRFAWPVRGRVLAAYGVTANGTHNDGINIAAAKGAPVAAIEGGVVAYAGNELRGYGNLVLIKHPDGLISAYAHCEELLVKRGEQVNAGQVIARVGATGGVSEPQLHFELRRGKKAIDPREFLSPAPSAAAASNAAG